MQGRDRPAATESAREVQPSASRREATLALGELLGERTWSPIGEPWTSTSGRRSPTPRAASPSRQRGADAGGARLRQMPTAGRSAREPGCRVPYRRSRSPRGAARDGTVKLCPHPTGGGRGGLMLYRDAAALLRLLAVGCRYCTFCATARWFAATHRERDPRLSSSLPPLDPRNHACSWHVRAMITSMSALRSAESADLGITPPHGHLARLLGPGILPLTSPIPIGRLSLPRGGSAAVADHARHERYLSPRCSRVESTLAPPPQVSSST